MFFDETLFKEVTFFSIFIVNINCTLVMSQVSLDCIVILKTNIYNGNEFYRLQAQAKIQLEVFGIQEATFDHFKLHVHFT